MQGTPLISPIFGTAALKDTGLVEGTVPIRIAGGALVGPMAWSQITTTPTTLNGYGITDGVRSVGLSLPAQFTISDSPVTGTGTLTAVWASQTQSHVLAAPIDGNGTPAFRALVATDIPALNQNTTGTAANVTGIVAIANGGTGATTDATARTALGATTVGSNLFTLANPSDITFPRLNADNTVSALNASDFRTAIGAGSIATQNSNNVTITGGSIAGITNLAIADGGTGASTAENARTNLGATTVGSNLFTLPNPSAITFPRLNADNSVSALNAADFRTAIGAMANTAPVIITNANGTAYRFASGLQICFGVGIAQDASTAIGGVAFSSIVQTWTYPAAFNSPPVCSGRVEGTIVRWMTFAPVETNTPYVQYRGGAEGDLLTSKLLAIGTYTP
jgi:hypothetical protein